MGHIDTTHLPAARLRLAGVLFFALIWASSPRDVQAQSWHDVPEIRAFLPESGFGSRHPDAPAELEHWGQLAGVWRAEQEMRDQSGAWVTVAPALWAWRYALGGFMVQDLFFQAEADLPEYLSALGRNYLLTGNRFYDPRKGEWNVWWIANSAGHSPGDDYGAFTAQSSGDRVVMMSPARDGFSQRVSFNEITPRSFTWLSEISQDGGKTWVAVMRVRAVRLAP